MNKPVFLTTDAFIDIHTMKGVANILLSMGFYDGENYALVIFHPEHFDSHTKDDLEARTELPMEYKGHVIWKDNITNIDADTLETDNTNILYNVIRLLLSGDALVTYNVKYLKQTIEDTIAQLKTNILYLPLLQLFSALLNRNIPFAKYINEQLNYWNIPAFDRDLLENRTYIIDITDPSRRRKPMSIIVKTLGKTWDLKQLSPKDKLDIMKEVYDNIPELRYV